MFKTLFWGITVIWLLLACSSNNLVNEHHIADVHAVAKKP